jgi:hypothetical protein
MKNAPNIFQLPKLKRQKKDDKLQPPKQVEPLPWGEGEPEVPQPPFLPAA